MYLPAAQLLAATSSTNSAAPKAFLMSGFTSILVMSLRRFGLKWAMVTHRFLSSGHLTAILLKRRLWRPTFNWTLILNSSICHYISNQACAWRALTLPPQVLSRYSQDCDTLTQPHWHLSTRRVV